MIPIITYHAFGEARSPVFTSPAAFEKQLDAFAEAGYQSLSLAALVDWLKGRAALPQNGLVLTFDDGYETVFTQARPLMEIYGFTGTIFVVTDYCGRTNQWPGQPAGIPERPLLTWSQLGELAESGWELAAHTRSHPSLPRLSPASINEELLGSQLEINHQLGVEPKLFAQPYGLTNDTVDLAVKQYFDGAAGTVLGVCQKGINPFHLTRIDAYYLRPWLIKNLKRPSGLNYLRLRQQARNLRQRFPKTRI